VKNLHDPVKEPTGRRNLSDELIGPIRLPKAGRLHKNGVCGGDDSRLRRCFEDLKDAVFIETPEGRIIDVNKAACQMLGYSKNELLKMDVSKIVTPEVAKTLAKTIKPSTVREGVYVETQNMRKDGGYVPVEVSCTLIENKGQLSVIAVLRDISERKAAEKTLKESEERFQKIFDNSKEGILIEDEDGNLLDANRSVCDMLGYTKEELCARTVRDIAPPELQVRLPKKYPPEWLKIGKYIETVIMRKDGMNVPVEMGKSLVEIGGEKRIINIVRDISERKRVAEILRKSELKYRTLLENLPQRIIYKNVNSVYISCNENFAMDMKMKLEEIVGKTDFDLFQKELAESYRKVDRQVMRSGKTEYFEEKYMKGRRELVVQTVKTPVRDEKGRITGILGIFWDITRRKQDEEKLKKYQQRLEEMVEERTAKLAGTNERLRQEINERRETEKALRESEGRLRERKMALERKNIALGEMIEQIGHEKEHVKNDVVVNVEKLLLPILRKLEGGTTHIESKYIDLLRRTCEELASSFGRKISAENMKLSPREIEICNMIKGGLSGKEIAELLKICFKTVERHRNDIRKKFKLIGKKVNLTTFLRNL
jgi:PAS domain S-box-containing protein